jgi:hypothetical protein
MQQLEFEFRTDQTALGPLIQELEAAMLSALR